MAEVYVGLGSNLGDRVALLRSAVQAIGEVMAIERVSSLWETEPVGLRDQPAFLNAVLRGRTELPARELLAALIDIEERLGRRRGAPNAPRTIDLDLLAYDGLRVSESGLEIPHPRMEGRRFVLAPLAEIAPTLRLRPGGPTVAELLAGLPPAEAVERHPHVEWPPPAR
ncbi:MAG: 2-amino-4-hydroxy-6-hydroxymethyldihydropteridine diphosphokinase [Gemmatimonadetes bacterium]|nr:2-amino-4-hydroxy-6-hydroxymethyldihydropteridine diphosphokinase [Gemmatimonadota bacterium]